MRIQSVILYMLEVSKLLCMEDNCSMICMSEVSKVKKYMYVVCTHLMLEVSKVKKYMYVVCTHLMSEVSKVKKYMYVVCTRLMSEVSKFTNVQNYILVFNDTVYTLEVSKEILTM